jgi:hypothetical protein
VRIFREEVFGAAVDVRKVAAASAGDQDLLACAFGVLQQHDAPSTPSGFERTHHAGRSCAQHYDINLLHVCSPALATDWLSDLSLPYALLAF